jgi:hypothetical protein
MENKTLGASDNEAQGEFRHKCPKSLFRSKSLKRLVVLSPALTCSCDAIRPHTYLSVRTETQNRRSGRLDVFFTCLPTVHHSATRTIQQATGTHECGLLLSSFTLFLSFSDETELGSIFIQSYHAPKPNRSKPRKRCKRQTVSRACTSTVIAEAPSAALPRYRSGGSQAGGTQITGVAAGGGERAPGAPRGRPRRRAGRWRPGFLRPRRRLLPGATWDAGGGSVGAAGGGDLCRRQHAACRWLEVCSRHSNASQSPKNACDGKKKTWRGRC